MTRILFVDDEINILQGLKRSLWSLKSDWDMHFAEGAKAALEIMRKEPFDVIVTDMRMPITTGLELLEQVRSLYPKTIRFILSGQTDRDTALRSACTAHQFLSKPCETSELLSAVERATQLNRTLASEELKTIVVQMRTIPSLPSLYHELVQEMDKPEPSLRAICSIIERDIGMTAKVLQMVNSAFFGSPRRIESVSSAASMLGLDTLRALVLAANVFGAFNNAEIGWFDIETQEAHGILTSHIAKCMATEQELDRFVVSNAMICGLLHDIGKIVLANSLPTRYRTIMRAVDTGDVSQVSAEREIFGTTHTELGGYLLGLWGFPSDIIEGIVYHHQPSQCPSDAITLPDIIHLADHYSHAITNTMSTTSWVDYDHYSRKGLDLAVEGWNQLCQEKSKQILSKLKDNAKNEETNTLS